MLAIDAGTTGAGYFNRFYLRRMADASMIVDGTLQALVARVPLLYSLDMRSGSDASGYQAGKADSAPVGFRISATPFTSTCLNDPYGNPITLPGCIMELGGGVNLNGYPLSTLAVARLANGGVWQRLVAGSYTWICPTGITTVRVTLVGAGGGGSLPKEASPYNGGSGGGGGGTQVRQITVVPGTSYTIIVGAGGIGQGANGGSTSISGNINGVANTTISAGGGGGSTQSGFAGLGGQADTSHPAGSTMPVAGITIMFRCDGGAGSIAGSTAGSSEFTAGGTSAGTTYGGGGGASVYGAGANGSAPGVDGATPSGNGGGASGGGGGANSIAAGGTGAPGMVQLIY
jgi:hypothetical protein